MRAMPCLRCKELRRAKQLAIAMIQRVLGEKYPILQSLYMCLY